MDIKLRFSITSWADKHRWKNWHDDIQSHKKKRSSSLWYTAERNSCLNVYNNIRCRRKMKIGTVSTKADVSNHAEHRQHGGSKKKEVEQQRTSLLKKQKKRDQKSKWETTNKSCTKSWAKSRVQGGNWGESKWVKLYQEANKRPSRKWWEEWRELVLSEIHDRNPAEALELLEMTVDEELQHWLASS